MKLSSAVPYVYLPVRPDCNWIRARGEKGAAQAAYCGKRVALIERESDLGGAAANTGTLPSKTLRETALYLSVFRQRGLFCVNMTFKKSVTTRDFLYREKLVKETEHQRIQGNLDRHEVDVYRGLGSLVDLHTVRVTRQDESFDLCTADYVLLVTGSRPFRPEVFLLDDPRLIRLVAGASLCV